MQKSRPAIAACLVLFALPAWSEGGGGGGGGGGVVDIVPADPDYVAGEQAVKKQDWPEALARMNAVVQRDPKNADAWNYMGYAYRHLGDMDNSFKYYQRALQIRPKHRGAHEYMGEAYLQVGQLAPAEEHLKALDKICWLPCEEYRDLKKKIENYKRDHPN
ncbi:tetratricopeptide repeat protein [Piscinibacter sp.]|uniref:tetratricopeptide repeat protein n=1 Tax=Piscinibacter sp. TaxID=1903157 RepID=UPI002F3E9418